MQRRLASFLTVPWRLVLLVGLLVGVPVLVLGETSAHDTRARLREGQLSAVSRESEQGAQLLSQHLASLGARLRTVGLGGELRFAVLERNSLAARFALVTGRVILGVDVAQLIATDRADTIVATGVPGESLEGTRFRPPADLAALEITPGSAFRIGPARPLDIRGGSPGVPLVTLLGGSGTGVTAGALTALVDMRVLSFLIDPLVATSEAAYIVDGDGQLIGRAVTFTGSEWFKDLRGSPLVMDALGGRRVRADAADPLSGRMRLVASAPVAGTNWHVFVVRSIEPLFRELEPVLFEQRVARIALVALLLVASFLLARALGEAERQQRSRWSRFLPPQIADLVAHEDAPLATHRRELSVLFSDVRGFTAHGETLEPEELVAMLNQHLSAMTEVVFAHDGTLDKYLGDGLMAFFGDPAPQPDHAERAVRCGIAMQRRLAELQRRWFADGRPRLAMGVGINSGWVTVGLVGSASRSEYTVIGDNVNVASRLAAAAAPGEVLLSEKTWRLLQAAVPVEPRAELAVKGKAEPLRVFAAEVSETSG